MFDSIHLLRKRTKKFHSTEDDTSDTGILILIGINNKLEDRSGGELLYKFQEPRMCRSFVNLVHSVRDK